MPFVSWRTEMRFAYCTKQEAVASQRTDLVAAQLPKDSTAAIWVTDLIYAVFPPSLESSTHRVSSFDHAVESPGATDLALHLPVDLQGVVRI